MVASCPSSAARCSSVYPSSSLASICFAVGGFVVGGFVVKGYVVKGFVLKGFVLKGFVLGSFVVGFFCRVCMCALFSLWRPIAPKWHARRPRGVPNTLAASRRRRRARVFGLGVRVCARAVSSGAPSTPVCLTSPMRAWFVRACARIVLSLLAIACIFALALHRFQFASHPPCVESSTPAACRRRRCARRGWRRRRRGRGRGRCRWRRNGCAARSAGL